MKEDKLNYSYFKDMADNAHNTMSNEKQIELIKNFKETGDVSYQDILISSNLRYIYNIAKKFNNNYHIQMDDLISAGCRGMVHAMEKFDENNGASFVTYASWWIKQEMRKESINFWSIMRIPQNAWHLMKKIKKLHKEGMTEKDIAIECDTKVDTVKFFIKFKTEFSMDDSFDGDDNRTFDEFLGEEDKEYIEDLKEHLIGLIELLTDREAEVIKMRYGIDYDRPHTLEEISQIFDRTKERIRQIQNQALGKLRKKLGDDNNL